MKIQKFKLQLRNLLLSRKSVFTRYYDTAFWGEESKSGCGSTLAYTDVMRARLPGLLSKYKINRILDAPCGDFNWFKELDLEPEIQYIGADIVESMVMELNVKYADGNRKFVVIDIAEDRLPQADVLFCRDVLFHMSHRTVKRAIRNYYRSEIPLLMTTTHYTKTPNKDIITGGFRTLNLLLSPYNFPPPREMIDDYVEGHHPRGIGVWFRDDIPESLR
jgi:hypothetical protein